MTKCSIERIQGCFDGRMNHRGFLVPLVPHRANWTGGVGGVQRSEGDHLFVVLYFQPDGSAHSPGDVQEALNHHLSIPTLLQRDTRTPAWCVVTVIHFI